MLGQVLARDATEPAGEDLKVDGEDPREEDDEQRRVAVLCPGLEVGRIVARVDVSDPAIALSWGRQLGTVARGQTMRRCPDRGI